MRNKWILLAVVFIIVGAVGLGIEFARGNLLDRFSAQTPYDQTAKLDMSQINSISIFASAGNLKIAPSDGNMLRVHVYGKVSKNIQDDVKLMVEKRLTDSAEINFNHRSKWYTVPDIANVTIEVSVPKKQYKNMQIKSMHGSLTMDSLASQSLEVKAGNDKVEIVNVHSPMNIKTNNGNINIQDEKISNNMQLVSDNGDVSLNLSQNPNDLSYDLHTKNGAVTFLNQSGSNHVAGRIGKNNHTLKISSSNGDITVATIQK